MFRPSCLFLSRNSYVVVRGAGVRQRVWAIRDIGQLLGWAVILETCAPCDPCLSFAMGMLSFRPSLFTPHPSPLNPPFSFLVSYASSAIPPSYSNRNVSRGVFAQGNLTRLFSEEPFSRDSRRFTNLDARMPRDDCLRLPLTALLTTLS